MSPDGCSYRGARPPHLQLKTTQRQLLPAGLRLQFWAWQTLDHAAGASGFFSLASDTVAAAWTSPVTTKQLFSCPRKTPAWRGQQTFPRPEIGGLNLREVCTCTRVCGGVCVLVSVLGQVKCSIPRPCFVLFCFRERERERAHARAWGRGRGRGRHRIRSRLQALSCQHKARLRV